MNISRLGLGTVQFGKKYGFNNSLVRKQNEVNKILDLSIKYKISILDTAYSYLTAEKKIGNYKKNNSFKIITKIPEIKSDSISEKEIENVKRNFYKSLKNMKKKNIYGILIHNFKDIYKPGSIYLINLLKQFKKDNLVKKIGISIYKPKQLKEALRFFYPDIVQFPLNLLDQRFLNINFHHYKRIEFHARSVFLQGLLLHDLNKIPNYFLPIKKSLEQMKNYFYKKGLNQLEACIMFVFNQKKINHFILGVDNYTHLEEIISIFKKKSKNNKINFSQFSMNNSKFIDPRNWLI